MILSTSFVYGENKQKDLQNKLNENRQTQLRLDEQILELNSRIKEVEENIASTNDEINQLDLQINDIESEIKELETNISNNKQQLSKRIKVINSNYSMSYIKILLNSSSISDFLNNMYIVKEIVKQDKEILTELDENKEEVEKKKSKIEKKKAEQEDLKLLLLIIYNECFQNDVELDPILKSYLTVALHRFITIENNNQVDTVESVVIPEDTTTTNYNNNETFMTTKLNEDIIQRLVHNRAP
jgi:predicted  nucleic acid-binding Zn-ribbon protein